ncbi:Rne/Rng family ribonuclease [Paenirhodobacter populi]|uniref:Ribonuclease E n=1 Tax=Paenirhodobacter populi TaxID=2306993 RepID=A0A443JV98_9RHOB|nr:ribonuclease E/G [Sinirhodobacter populi]RWR24428.1 ribonuclease E/G [Sinirhodobacter populi]
MAKKMLIDATHAEETRVVVVDGNKVEEFDFETINKRQLAGNIYLAKVTRVEPSLQAAFVDYGGNRHGFLAFAEIHPDYYQIPVADRQALLEEERAFAEADEAEDRAARNQRRPRRNRGAAKAEQAAETDEVIRSEDIPGMDVVEAPETDEVSAEHVVPVPETGSAPETAPESADHDHDHGDHSHHDHSEDDGIESVADEDVQEEIHAPRKPRARRYKIQEVIKVRQIMLVQVVKEERGNKGAALTTYLSLAGRYCVLMPNTARGGGISRKITVAADRKKLKEIAGELEVPQGAGLIIRTAGAQRTRTEIRRDYEYLMRLWEQIRELTLKSIAPAPIYEEGDLIKRSIRDLFSKDIDEVLVEGERGYRVAKDFMKMIMPSQARMVKHYDEQLPLFARFQVESYLAGMFNPVVQLKSGGYLVIGVTEALVAIDVNSGRATKEGSIEETALKTNLEAAEEVARQARLRDLAGLIVIDFIDMEERRNNAAVEKRLKEKLKTDRARIQVGRISGFGLMEMSRQRLRPGMLESTTQPCPHCHGTGLIRSDDSLALQVLRAIEEEGTRKRSREVLVKCPVAVANYLMNVKREHIASIELRYGMAVRIEADPTLVSPDYSIEKFKTATRLVPEVHTTVVSASAELMAEIDEAEILDEEDQEEAEAETEETNPESAEDGDAPRKKKRRRRRKKKNGNGTGDASDEASDSADEDEAAPAGDAAGDDEAEEDAARAAAAASLAGVTLPELPPAEAVPEAPAEPAPEAVVAVAEPAEPAVEPAAEPVEEAPKKRTRRTSSKTSGSTTPRSRKKTAPAEAPAEAAPAAEAVPEAPKRRRSRKKAVAEETPAPEAVSAEAQVSEGTPETPSVPDTPDVPPAPAPDVPPAPETPPAPEPDLPTEPEVPPAPEPAVPAEPPVEVPGTPSETPDLPPVELPVPEPEIPDDAPQEVPDTSSDEASDDPDAPPKPKRRGWWSAAQ